ncbi:MAG: hypothetical protein ONB48_04995 [candidate division KSB1 bacterium]|nr:hypothetical protein [candidate division KSB1 bacterium]MDZ7274330.1 hypothetical protein [candidate division KSB1 bacterium]MDZ7285008.1 hypothetical protein [candidate division KSB1 bacterium]MDZ7297571.1 hypothetical protein [candidate division KSB1 bacterium]MDZ7309514.1 hypothetical protein [candidate division KSB1 bacterium]
MSKYSQIDLARVKTYPVQQRFSKVHREELARPFRRGDFFETFYESLPDILAAKDLREFVQHLLAARAHGKPIIMMMGAHVIKVGLSPVLIDLMQRGFITCLAMNGAGVVHDTELALFGQTSEEVAEGLADGSFGMAAETGEFINGTVARARGRELGLGEAMGEALARVPNTGVKLSLLANAYTLDVPATVHVGIGTDIIHQHPSADGAAYGELSYRDFKIFAAQVARLNQGGVVLNVGSNVLLPEVFLKALTVARNVAPPVNNFITANFDMFNHYRPRMNVVQRPTLQGGKGYNFIGHHEIMIPLLAAAVKEFA